MNETSKFGHVGESRPGNKKVKRKKKDKTSEIRVEPRESKEVS